MDDNSWIIEPGSCKHSQPCNRCNSPEETRGKASLCLLHQPPQNAFLPNMPVRKVKISQNYTASHEESVTFLHPQNNMGFAKVPCHSWEVGCDHGTEGGRFFHPHCLSSDNGPQADFYFFLPSNLVTSVLSLNTQTSQKHQERESFLSSTR